MSILALAIASLALSQSAGATIEAREADRLEACVAKIEVDPEEAYEDGLAWIYQGNRPNARQCTALALIALGRPDEGAARLEQLANSVDGGSMEQRAEYLIQSGNAWLQAGAPEAAIVTFTNALKLKPGVPDLLVDRASANLMLGNWTEAKEDLDRALTLAPSMAIARQLRAEAHLNLDQLNLAMADIDAAMAVDPENIDTLVLRGRVREALRLSKVRVLSPEIVD
ncbi:MAG: tetratricopeptide repeat protein [Hyphomonas sp.]|jgi:tetratricopeptide (TPR) repeat protein|uniref:tetratricopeptide repeat protein n=1 Tax=Hyphomonas sp. TaxID=87 RepID=UPI00326384A2